MVEQLEVAKKKDLIKNFGQLFRAVVLDSEGTENDKIPEAEYMGYMDPSNVCEIVPKTKSMKRLLVETYDVKESKYPELNYHAKDGEETTSKYSSTYLKVILELTKHYDTIKISVKKDYPLRVETTDFVYVLAPRIDND